jgi:hypothetical protein
VIEKYGSKVDEDKFFSFSSNLLANFVNDNVFELLPDAASFEEESAEIF